MNVSKKIRLATENDAESLLKIYGEFVKDTVVSFETEVPTVMEFGNRIRKVLENTPWLVYEIDGESVGYAYASKHRERAAYQWSVDVSIYINPRFHRMHIATALYTALMELLKMQGYYGAFAGITSPNPKSEGFHESFGFMPIGAFHNVGYKLGKWRDVKWFELTISDYPENPEIPIKISKIIDTEEFRNNIEKAMQITRSFD